MRFTCVLAVLADGTKLTPMVIFKRKTMPTGNFPGVHVKVQPKGWMDEKLMKWWCSNVWEQRPNGSLKKNSLLVMDTFSAHTTDSVKERLHDNRTALAIIPGGLTSICQPIDVSINKPFKAGMRKRWAAWMIDGNHTYTKGGRQRKAGLELVCQWVREAWEEIDQVLIIKSFLKCAISNSLDGTEDDALWEEEEIASGVVGDVVGGADDGDEEVDEDLLSGQVGDGDVVDEDPEEEEDDEEKEDGEL